MKLLTRLSKDGATFRFDYRIEVTAEEPATINRVGVEHLPTLQHGDEDFPAIAVDQFVEGQRFESESPDCIQTMEGLVVSAANSMKSLLQTLEGFGETKRREI